LSTLWCRVRLVVEAIIDCSIPGFLGAMVVCSLPQWSSCRECWDCFSRLGCLRGIIRDTVLRLFISWKSSWAVDYTEDLFTAELCPARMIFNSFSITVYMP
jgi:hypothetical protein